jgi:hypothetical protein
VSWKATAYVKGLGRDRVTAAEKLLLFVLADYHNTATKAAWPSLPLLAGEALISRSTARRLLRSLEEKRLLRWEKGIGRGVLSVYRFVEVDENEELIKGSILTPFSDGKGSKKGSKKGVKSAPPIRKEPVLEPVLGTGICDRNERDRRSGLTEARRRGMRDFQKHPLEDWEEPFTDEEIDNCHRE